MKNKSKTIILALSFLFVLSSIGVSATWFAGIDVVIYPTTINEGETFSITPCFRYNLEEDGCLARWKPVYLFYSINNPNIVLSSDGSAGDYFTESYEGAIFNTEDYRPESVTFTISSDALNLNADDIFYFQIRYWQAYYYDGGEYPATVTGCMLTYAMKEITVVEETEPTTQANLFLFSLILSLSSISLVSKKVKNKKVKLNEK